MTPCFLNVLYRDDFILAVDKPSGMLVHRGWDKDDVVLTDVIREMTGGGTVHPLHRLDRQTSGVVLFATDKETARYLSACFESGAVEKSYLALVRGETPMSGIIDHPIPRKEGGPRVAALTEFRRAAVLSTEPRHTSWVLARPRTGRLHQVRRHLKHISHPVIGDANYGKGDINRAFRERYGLCRTALHASSISFEHPEKKQRITVCAPLPPDLADPLARMGLSLTDILAENGQGL
jgi:tRNA pseudouridine65 synthase